MRAIVNLQLIIWLIISMFLQIAQASSPPVVSNVHAQKQEKADIIEITYELEDKDTELLTVMLLVSLDKGESFEQVAQTVSGDVGYGVAPGKNKTILWDELDSITDTDDERVASGELEQSVGTSTDETGTGTDETGTSSNPIVVGVFASDGIVALDGSEMVLIPAGEFYMGSDPDEGNPNEKPKRSVFLDAFYIDKYEVTNVQYYKFWKADGGFVSLHRPKSYGGAYDIGNWPKVSRTKPNSPVVGVNWRDALAYTRWTKKRLPTEAEWEKAARGVNSRIWPWGDKLNVSIEKTDAHANIRDNNDGYDNTVAPVGTYPTGGSPYGVYDMAGNVWEWCLSWYDPNYYTYAPKRNPSGPATGERKVIRGGSWFNGSGVARCAYRTGISPEQRTYSIGFRCVKDFVDPNRADEGISWSNLFFIDGEERPWDLNQDGVVNIFDLVIVGSHFGQSGENLDGDVDNDGVVNIFDLVLVGRHFGE